MKVIYQQLAQRVLFFIIICETKTLEVVKFYGDIKGAFMVFI